LKFIIRSNKLGTESWSPEKNYDCERKGEGQRREKSGGDQEEETKKEGCEGQFKTGGKPGGGVWWELEKKGTGRKPKDERASGDVGGTNAGKKSPGGKRRASRRKPKKRKEKKG